MLLLYNLFIKLYFLGIRIASLWNEKARSWLEGRENLFEELEKKIVAGDLYIWMHCASAGEFEQGKPIAEALKKQYPHYKMLISFFSSSGYRTAKDYTTAEVICY
ncbi:MAG TPA: glycosyltransferase N-terminal domain-containing protein, partial [Flavisolibacter sp.]|nr:glycosyltransferase N-terminal domain-containing protein [Flavisolibacter sp.]